MVGEMSRVLKFRAWDKEKKKMMPVMHGISVEEGMDPPYVPIETAFEWAGVIYELMQFTGHLDKNGKEIYEGDMVTGLCGKYLVEWDHEIAMFRLNLLRKKRSKIEHKNYHSIRMLYSSYGGRETNIAEVIGNIYEYPELLESK